VDILTIIYDNKEVNYYEKATTKIIMLEDAVLQGWQCPCDKLWHVPLVPNVQNLNTDTILLDHPLGHLSLHTMYEVANTTLTCQNIDAISLLAHHREYIYNIYELPSLEPTICYLHAAAGFPQKINMDQSRLMRQLQHLAPHQRKKTPPSIFLNWRKLKWVTCKDNARVSDPLPSSMPPLPPMT
jgi:hypothetical protein